MAALQIRAIPRVSLWFAPCPDPKSIAFICSIKHATLHQPVNDGDIFTPPAQHLNG
jgi:hypothetical protein